MNMKNFALAAVLTAVSTIFAVVPCVAAEVALQHHTFDVENTTIKAGESVTFTNNGDTAANIQVVDAHGNIDDKGLQKPGDGIQETLMTPGEYKVRDALHPKIAMRVIVQPQPKGPTVTSR